MKNSRQTAERARIATGTARAVRPALIALLLCGCASSAPQPRAATRVRLLAAQPAGPLVDRVRRPFLELTVRDPHRALTAIAATSRPTDEGLGNRAAAALKAARRAYRELDFAGAVARLTRTEADLVARARASAHFPQLAEIAFWRGVSHLARGELDAARQAVRWALRLGYPLVAGKHAPEIERFVQGVNAEKQPTGALSLAIEPADAQVLLDGKPLQRPATGAPLRVEAGLHHLRVDRLGHRGRGLVHLVSAGKVDRLEVALQRLDRPATAAAILATLDPRGKPPADPELLHRVLDDDAWLGLAPRGQPPLATVLWLADPGKATLRCSGEETPLADCLARGIYRLATGKDPPADRVAKRPLYRRWWFWTAAAAVTAGAAVGIYFGTRDGHQGTDVDIGIRDRSLNPR